MPFNEQQYEEQLKCAVTESLRILYENDRNLITRGNGNVHERSIVFRFGIYFQKIADICPWLRNYNIDVEYNRNIEESKETPIFGKRNPDFVVHKREQNSTDEEPYSNLLILEFKTHYNKSKLRKGYPAKGIKGDKEILSDWMISRVLKNGCVKKEGAIMDYLKIRDFMRYGEYLYRFGASIILEEDTPVWCWMDGEDFREIVEGEIEYPVYTSFW